MADPVAPYGLSGVVKGGSAAVDDDEWKALLRETVAANTPKPGVGEAVARGGLQGVTSGFADEAAARIEQGVSKIPGVRSFAQMFQPDGSPPLTDPTISYEQRRDYKRGQNADARQAHPYAFGAGQVAGGVAQSIVPAARAATLGKAAVQGGIAGLGYSDADTVGGMATDAGLGAGIGAAGKVVGDAIGSGVRKVVGGAPARAEDRAFKSLGDQTKQQVKDKLSNQRGRVVEALKEPAIRKAIGDPGKMLDAVRTNGDKALAASRGIYDSLDQAAGGGIPVQDITIPLHALRGEMLKGSEDQVAINVVDRVIDQYRRGLGANPSSPVPSAKVRDWLTRQVQKRGYERGDPNNPPVSQEAYQRASGVIKDAIAGYAKKHGGAQTAAEVQALNDRMTAYAVIERAAEEQAKKAGQAPGPVSQIASFLKGSKAEGIGGAVGYAVGGPGGAVIGATAGNVAKRGAVAADDALATKAGQRIGAAAAGGGRPLGRALSQPVMQAVEAGDHKRAIDLMGEEVYGE